MFSVFIVTSDIVHRSDTVEVRELSVVRMSVEQWNFRGLRSQPQEGYVLCVL